MRSPPVRACCTNKSSTSQVQDTQSRTRGETKQHAGIYGEYSFSPISLSEQGEKDIANPSYGTCLVRTL
jgi:hypothetical protein